MTTEREIAGRTAVLFDPHPLWLEAVTQVLSNAGVEVRAATSAVSEALSALEEHRPSVFVTALLVGEGHSNAALARMLWVTEQTVKFHLSNIYRKLGVANRTEASRWAQLNGLITAEQSDTSAHVF